MYLNQHQVKSLDGKLSGCIKTAIRDIENNWMRTDVLCDISTYFMMKLDTSSAMTPVVLPVESFDFSTRIAKAPDTSAPKSTAHATKYRTCRGGKPVSLPGTNGKFYEVDVTYVDKEEWLDLISFSEKLKSEMRFRIDCESLRFNGYSENPSSEGMEGHILDPFRAKSIAILPEIVVHPFYKTNKLQIMVVNILTQYGSYISYADIVAKIKKAISPDRSLHPSITAEIEETLLDLWMIRKADRLKGGDGLDYFQISP